MVPTEIILALDLPPISPCLPVSCVLFTTYHHLNSAPHHLGDLSVPGDATFSVKEGPGCSHSLSADFHQRLPSRRPGRTLPMGVEQGLSGALERGSLGPPQWSG